MTGIRSLSGSRTRTSARRGPRVANVLVGAAAVVALAGCSPTPAATGSTATPPTATAGPSGPSDPPGDSVTSLTLTVDGRTVTARLDDNPTAAHLVRLLPLTLRFSDVNGVEKVATLPEPLTMQGVPRGADPEPDDLGYYAPAGVLVLYYDDVGYFDGIVRLGRIDPDDMAFLRERADGAEATLDAG